MKTTWCVPAAAPARRAVTSARPGLAALAAVSLAAVLAACGGGSSAKASSSATTPANNGSCAGIAGAHHARVVVEPAPGKVTSRCVGFSTPTIAATDLLSDSHVQLGTQKYSFGLAICQVEHVPAHYSQCLPSGKDYWALFVSKAGQAWQGATTGVSDLHLGPGDSLGLRYDPPKGTPAPPPPPSRA